MTRDPEGVLAFEVKECRLARSFRQRRTWLLRTQGRAFHLGRTSLASKLGAVAVIFFCCIAQILLDRICAMQHICIVRW